MNEYFENRILVLINANKARKRWIALVLCLAVLVGFGTVNALKHKADAMTEKVRVLDCHASVPAGDGYAGCVVHVHNEDCYDAGGELVCPLPEIYPHVHTEACYRTENVLVCEQDACPHVHGEACYSAVQGALICGLAEEPGHIHNDGCYTEIRSDLICGLAENEEHQHTDGCYAWARELSCGQEERAGHEHTAACYEWTDELICGLEEGAVTHTHSKSCYVTETKLVCGQQELHTHTSECYDGSGDLVCGLLQLEEHVHGPGCFIEINAEGLEALPDPEADVESWQDYAARFDNMDRSGPWNELLVSTAHTQLGYAASARNFIVDESGSRRSYTRYGAWYGTPYGEWNTLFVAFCLHFSDIPEEVFPFDPDIERWIEALEKQALFSGADQYVPRMGDVVFFDDDEDGLADQTGIVISCDRDTDRIRTIEGGRTDRVQEFEYKLTERTILGYGILPERPDEEAETAFPVSDMVSSPEQEEQRLARITAADGSSLPGEVSQYGFALEGAEAENAQQAVERFLSESAPVRMKKSALRQAVQTSAAPTAADTVISETRWQVFDIGIEQETEMLTEQAYRVSVRLPAPITGRDFRLFHLGTDGTEELGVELEYGKGEAGDEAVIGFSFLTDSFSPFVLRYTVDFHFDVREFALDGGDSMLLSELFEALAVERSVSEVALCEFSDPSLLEVVKDDETGDWRLSSLAPFDTEEELRVTFADGSGIIIRVTDAQIYQDYLSADGNTYHIEVTLDDREVIEGEAELYVEELLEDSECYEAYLFGASESMMLEDVDSIEFARFFDIKILVDGSVFEPSYPVQVKISYQDAIELGDDQALSVVHFAHSGVEVIRAIELSEDGKELTYEQSGFSVIATVVSPNSLQDGHQYVIYTSSDSNYYAMTHYSEGRDEDIVHGVKINASTTTGSTINIQEYGSSIVWTAHRVTVGVSTYWTFSFKENGKTYYLRSYGGLMVGTDSDINESAYSDEGRYQWRIASARYNNQIINNTLRNYYSRNNNTYFLRYSSSAGGFKERDNYQPSSFYFADVSKYTQDIPASPKIHYVDESGNELAVVNGRDWTTDATTSPAFLINDIDGYEYVKTTMASPNGTEIRPILKAFAGKWQYTTSEVQSTSINWSVIPPDAEEPDRLEDIYVVYKPKTEPVNGGTPKLRPVQDSQPPEKPEITKASTVNGDGTNTLALSVTGHTAPLEVEKLADVIVIFDTSTSMRRHMGTSTDTYESNNTPVGDYRDHDTRMWIAADAVMDLADTLIGDGTTFKNSNNDKLIRMSLISFNRSAALECGFTDDPTTFKTAVNGLKTEAGTNWEAALDMANHLAVDPERATFVIFVTDGNPSYRTSRGNLLSLEGYPETVDDGHLDVNTANNYYFYRALQYFGALDENDPRNYNTAETVVKSITAHRKNLYSIGIGNAAGITRLEGLTTAAYGGNAATGAERTKTAENPEELAQAFSDIAASIVALLGHSDIRISDGITDLTQTVQKSTLVNFEEDDFTYYKGKVVVATQADVDAGRAEKVGDPIPATQADVVAGLAAKVGGTKVESWNPWDPVSEGCAKAVYNSTSGAVEWNMGEGFMPQDGYTYQVRFKVWPSQAAYDLLADLNNGKKSYDSLSDAEKAQIQEPTTAGGMYTLKTNSETSYTYREATKSGDTITPTGNPSDPGHFEDVDPLALTTKPLKVKKQWHYNYVDSRTLTDRITMELYGVAPDGTTSRDFKTITLSKDDGWYAENNYVSYGLVTYDTTTNAGEKIYETGHDFTLRETDSEAHYYELTAGVYRPMFINNIPTILERLSAMPDGMSGTAFHYSAGGDDYYHLDGNYYKDTKSDVLLIATNSHRSYMDITKTVTTEDGSAAVSGQLFEFEVTFTVPDGIDNYATEQYIFASIKDENGNDLNHLTDVEKTEGFWVPSELAAKIGANVSYYSGFDTSQRIVVSGKTFTMKIKPGWNVRFVNLPNGTTYTINEVNIPEGYSFKKAEVTGTRWIANMVDGVDQGSADTITGLPANDGSDQTNTGISGSIQYANARYETTYTNTVKTQQVEILKTNQDESRPLPGAVFDLYTKSGYEADPKSATRTNLTSDDNGKIELGRLSIGEYYLLETQAPAGYIPLAEPIRITVNAEKVLKNGSEGGVSYDSDTEAYKLAVANNAGYELPSTGGIGTVCYAGFGAVLVLGSAAALLARRRKQDWG